MHLRRSAKPQRRWPTIVAASSLEAMAEGSPVLALERGERVELPPVLYLQGTRDIANPRPDLDRFVMQYRRAGGQVEPELFEGEAVEGRNAIQRILLQEDHRLLVIVGPCSIHDPEAALGYAGRLNALRQELADRLCAVMRVYFEKPRTTIGWKGLIYDPHLDGSDDMETGLRLARQLLLAINGMGLPAGTEMLDTITPQYHADLITWAAIGARTSEGQIHREMASGLSMPVGFKNSTEGNLQVAINALQSADPGGPATAALWGVGDGCVRRLGDDRAYATARLCADARGAQNCDEKLTRQAAEEEIAAAAGRVSGRLRP